MGVLEKVMQMKSRGSSEEEISLILGEEGFSPKDIKKALEQSRVKSAINKNDDNDAPSLAEELPPPPSPGGNDYSGGLQEIPKEEMYAPNQGQEMYAPNQGQEMYAPNQGQEYYQQATDETQGYYEPQSSVYPSETYGTDTMIEISEQVFSENVKKINKSISELNEFKVLYQTKIEDAIERIKRIESVIDKLQISILDKIGSYGENLESIKNEMSMMEDSFSKMISSLHSKKPKKESE